MRILILGLNFAPELTGIGKYTGELAAWLAAREHTVRVITTPPYYPSWKFSPGYSGYAYRKEMLGRIEVWRCPLWVPRRVTGIKRIFHLISFSISSLPAVLLSIRWRPEVVLCIAPTLTCAPWAVLLSRVLGISAWLHVHDFELDASLELGVLANQAWLVGILRRLEGIILRGFDRVSTISDRMLEKLQAKGVERERIVLFRNWVDTTAIFPMEQSSGYRDELHIPLNQIVVLYAGNMGMKQRLETVLETAEQLGSHPEITFVLCGDGAARQTIEERAKLLPNVRMMRLQPMDRMNELLNLADIHVLPQRSGFADLVMPSKLAGMFASGKPVIATAAPETEVGEVVSAIGLLVPPEDASRLSEAILSLAKDKSLRDHLGMLGRKYAQDNLGRERILINFERQLVALLGAEETRIQ